MKVGITPVSLADIARVVYDREQVEIDDAAIDAIRAAADFVREQAESGTAVYGVTTGFGANRDRVIRPQDATTLQHRLIMSHACGVGPALPAAAVRAMMLLRVAALSRGNSGIRVATLQLLVDMLNRGVHPIVPELGSVGASGDLCPLAHMCLPMIGLGEAEFHGELLSGADAMAAAELQPIQLTYKEGLALLNGTQAQTAVGAITAIAFTRLLDNADVIGAMSLEAVAGRTAALDPRIHIARGRRGQIQSAANVRAALVGSSLAGAGPGQVEGKVEYVQDSYCLRCLPQVHGACRDVLDHVVDVLEVEANAVTDNPLVFAPSADDDGAILSGGNFHGEPVAMALDYLKIAIAELASISERRCAKLIDKYFSEGLPPFLVSNPGLNSGMMIPQYVAAALVSENKGQAHPASVDSIPTSANMEDHVSMGMHAGVQGLRILRNTERVLGIEYLIAAQALNLRVGHELGVGTGAALARLRKEVPFMEEDRVLYPDINVATRLVSTSRLVD